MSLNLRFPVLFIYMDVCLYGVLVINKSKTMKNKVIHSTLIKHI